MNNKVKFEMENNSNYVTGIIGEQEIILKVFSYDGSLYQVLVSLDNNKEYYNVYIINELFKIDPSNCLKEQIPANNKPENWEFYTELRAIEFYLWIKHNKSFSIDYEEIDV